MQKATDNVFWSFRFLFTSWQESLLIFSTSQLKLFFLATVKSIKDFYHLFIQKNIFSLYFILGLVIQLNLFRLDNKLVQLIAGLFITILIVNALRPSVALKDSSYFRGMFFRAILFVFDIVFFFIFMPYAFITGIQSNYILVLAAFLLLLTMGLEGLFRNKNISSALAPYRMSYILYGALFLLYTLFLWYLIFAHHTLNWSGSSTLINFLLKARSLVLSLLFINETWLFADLSTMAYFLSPFVIIMILFVTDAQTYNLKEYCKAIGRAALMVFYNYPFFILLYLAVCLVIYLFSILGNFLPSHVPMRAVGTLLVSTVILPIYISIITSFYIKRLHEQFQLYYRDN